MQVSDPALCDCNCNECPIVGHPNSRILTAILNKAHEEYGDEFYKIVQDLCPNLTVCYECRIDDFVHCEGCKILNHVGIKV
jgi:hypothetical protein